MTVSTRKLMATCAVAALAVTIYGCSDSTEDRLRGERDEAVTEAAEAQMALMMAEQRATEAETARMMAEQAQMMAEEARAEADRLRMEAEEAARMASGDAAAAELRATAAEQRATDAEADAAAAREALAMAETARMMAEQRATEVEGELDALTKAVVSRELASTIDKVANYGRMEGPSFTSGFWHTDATGGAEYGAAVSQNINGGAHAFATASHDESGQLHFNVALIQQDPTQSANPYVLEGRYLNTDQNIATNLEGVTRSRSATPDSELADWHVEVLTNSYESGGTLDIQVATDVLRSDGSLDPWREVMGAEYSINLPSVPRREADNDFIFARIGNGESIAGSLDDVTGTFSCANPEGCTFLDDRHAGAYYANDSGVTFTPDGGTAQQVVPLKPLPGTAADYLVFGHWLYVPNDVLDADAYDFGAFASGGDAFAVADLMPLTGTATYSGDAAGVYYANGLSRSADVGDFTADVELMADFKLGSEYGTVGGTANNFVFDGDANSPFSSLYPAALNLSTYTYSARGVQQQSQNIFDRSWPHDSDPQRGGWINGITFATTETGESFEGPWFGKFFGNDDPSSDLPTSIGGTFSAFVNPGNNQQSDRGLAGSFGAHRQ